MRSRMFSPKGAAIGVAIAAVASVSPVSAQSGKPGLYAYPTAPVTGGCPGLDWHITVEPDNRLVGFVAWDQGQHMARLIGSINKDRSFEMQAEEVGGTGRKATVKGIAAGDDIKVVINGSGTACDGENLTIPRVVGGMSGGGG
jgi:hypothetical protein